MNAIAPYNRRMIPAPDTRNQSPEYVQSLLERIGRSQKWIAENSGISRRRLQYLLVGWRDINGERKPVVMSYPEQYTLEALAAAGERFTKS